MQTEPGNLDSLLARLTQLSASDRKGVLRSMPLEQRYAVENLLKRKPAPHEPKTQTAPRKFLQFSSMLIRMLAAIENGDDAKGGDGRVLSAATSLALLEIAEQIESEDRKATNPNASIWSSLSRFLFPERVG